MELALRPTQRPVFLEKACAIDGKAPFSRPCAETCIESLLRPFRLLFAFLQKARGTASAETNERAAFFRQRAGLLLDAYGDSILRLAYSYLHNRSDAEDILQDTLMKYLTAQPDCESETHEKAWLMRVAINLSKNRIESNRYRRRSARSGVCVGRGAAASARMRGGAAPALSGGLFLRGNRRTPEAQRSHSALPIKPQPRETAGDSEGELRLRGIDFRSRAGLKGDFEFEV